MSTTWLEISKKALIDNLSLYKSFLKPNIYLCAVLKGNAYGHGLKIVAHVCQERNEVDGIAVATIQEALQLRSVGITKPILAMCVIDIAYIKKALLNDISLVAYDLVCIEEVNRLAQQLDKKANIHIKIDTGFSRAGILTKNAFDLIKQSYTYSHIHIQGMLSHYSDSSSDDFSFTHKQQQEFNQLLALLDKNSIFIPLIHCANTAAIPFGALRTNSTMIRLGIGMYGLWPSYGYKQFITTKFPQIALQPALTWKAKIIHSKIIPANSYVGYGLTYKTSKETKIALLPIGYWDGYDRKLSNCGVVKIGSFFAPILGTVCMNLSVIDVTLIPDHYLNHEVVLLGNDPAVSADTHAEKIGTVNYEVITRINPLISRILVD